MLNRMKLYEVILKAKEKEFVVIVGSGCNGKYIALQLKKNGIEPLLFFDNDKNKIGKAFEGVEVCIPKKIQGKCLYIISVEKTVIADELYKQLLDLGVQADSFEE